MHFENIFTEGIFKGLKKKISVLIYLYASVTKFSSWRNSLFRDLFGIKLCFFIILWLLFCVPPRDTIRYLFQPSILRKCLLMYKQGVFLSLRKKSDGCLFIYFLSEKRMFLETPMYKCTYITNIAKNA
jgi:hypothetical protein